MSKRSVIQTNDGYLMLLDAIYFNGRRIGCISEEGLDWGGENVLGIEFGLKVLAPLDGSSPGSILPTEPFIEADPTSLTFEQAGGSLPVDIEASGPFSVGAVPEGFSVEVVNGRVTVIAEANSSGSSRSGNLEFILESDPETKATVSLSQPNA